MRRSNLSYKTHLLRISAILCLLSSYFWIAPGQIHALSVGFQEYYVLGSEEHIWRTFDRIQGQEGGPSISTHMCSVVALVATADNQMVYYDHWEDGYEADLLTPTQGSTEVYGDGDTGNGGKGSDILVAGDIITLNSDQNDSTKNGYVSVNPRNPSDIRYDGGDHLITSGGPVDLAHAMWPYDQSYIGGAWEIYSLQAYQLAYSYRLPIGEDLYAYGGGDTGYFGDFQYVDLQLQALYDNTTVSIDNGTDTVNITLDKGQTYSSMGYIDSTYTDTLAITINAGTTILSDKQTQVGLVTGSDGRFQTRLLIILPDLVWGTEYIAPVPRGISPIGGYGDREAEVYIFNPNGHDISVTAYDGSGTGTFSIASNAISSTVAYSQPAVMNRYVPIDSAVRLVSGDPFGVIVVADTSNITYDWGLSAIPVRYLTQDYYISWAPGSSNNPPTENGSPVWVTPLADDTTFYVDYGPVDGTVDLTFSLDTLEQGRIFDPDNDNTGMHVWATGKFAVAWGQDPATADVGLPYLDLGLTTLPLYQGWLDPVLSLEKTADPETLPVEGGTATFFLEAKTSSLSPVNNVDITDTLPISWTYVGGSTIVTYPDGSTDSPDPVQSGQNLFWNLSHEMDSNQTLRLEFDAQIQTGGSVGATRWDGFEDQVQPYSDGTGDWASDWVENGDGGGSSASGMIRIVVSEGGVNPYSGSRQLSLRNDDDSVDVYIERSVNLSDFARPMLRFKRYAHSLDSSDENFYLDIHDGSSWYTGVITWTDGSQEGAWVQEEVDLSAYAATTTTIRFRSPPENKSDGDRLYIDDVEIYDAVVVNENEGQVVGEYRGHVFNAADEAVVYISALDIEKAVDRSAAGVGDTIEYTLTYQNNGPITTTGTHINDTIPWGTTFSGASSGGSYSSATNTVSWMLSDVAPSETGSVTFTVTVDDGTPHGTVIENSGWINSDQTGQVSSNLVETTVLAHDLTVVKSDNPDPVAAGMILTYTLVYTNNGPSNAQNVYITDTVPADVTFGRVVSEAPPLPSFNRDGQHLTWYTPTLAADASGTIVCAVTVNPDASGTITNNVVIASSTLDADPDNNEDNEPTAIGIPTLATIYGTVFDDANGDGVQGAGEGGIADVRLTLDDTITTTTKSDGSYMFFTTVTGTHTVVETDPDGYFSTTSNEVHVEVGMGNSYRVNFGDALDDSGFAAIHGIVFEDSDGDGVWDAGEMGIEGVTITLDGSATATTNLHGSYTFSTTVIGTHTVVESDPVGYFSTTSNEVHVDVELGHGYQVDFGDAPDSSNFASIHGTVFKDSDGDGVWDAGEVGIEGVTITLDGVIMTTTDLYGGYTFSTTVEGVHTVVETDPDGYFSTTSNEVHVGVSMGNGYRVDFGDAPDSSDFASIYGTVFEDSDGDGVWDAGEVGLSSVTITLDGVLMTTTDLYGGYTFSTTVEGVHTVVETDPDGYFSTTSNEVHVGVSMGNGYRVDFGDAPDRSDFASIYGTVFEDSDGDGVWDSDEVGIAGVLITMDGGATATTGSYGGYTFSTTVANTCTVVETDPDGYFSTTPNTVILSVELGQGYQVDFGDVPMEACICPPDSYEEDDVAGQAVGLSVDVRQMHDFCDDAIDWITFTAQAGNVYTIITSSWGQRADTFLALFDTDARTLLAANDDYEGATDYSSRIVWSAPADGVYYVRTTNRAGLTGCATDYDLLIESQAQPEYAYYLPIVMQNYGGGGTSPGDKVYPLGIISHTCPDGYETDDTWQQAQQPIHAGIVQVHSFDSDPQRYAADKDFVGFDVSPGRIITFTIVAITNTQTLLELYDEHGAALNVTGTTQLVWTPATTGRYYLSVSPLTTTFGCADVVGYHLLPMGDMASEGAIYLPIIMRDYR